MLATIRSSLLRQTRVAARPAATRLMSTPATPPQSDAQAEAKPPSLTSLISSIPDIDKVPENTKKWRIFYNGDIVKPSDLTPAKCANERKRTRRPNVAPPAPVARYNDIFRQLSVDPVDFSLNPSVLSAYVSEMGKIYGRNITGLTSRSQRRLGKAIRRARMIGVLPQLSRPSKQWVPTPHRLIKRT